MECASKPAAKKKSKATFTRYHLAVAVLTFFAYVATRANRKSFSNVKVLAAEEWSPSFFNETVRRKEPAEIWTKRNFFPSSNDSSCKTFLGILDTVFLAGYAAALYLGGFLGDRINLRYLLCLSLIGTSVSLICFISVAEWIGVYSIAWYITFRILNGLFQGPIWPSLLAIMGNWFGKAHRGLIFGVWTTSAAIGNIVGSLTIAVFVDYGYDMAVLVMAIIQIAVAIVLFFGLVISPAEVGLTLADFQEEERKGATLTTREATKSETPVIEEQDKLLQPGNDQVEVVEVTRESQQKAVGFVEALCLPGVMIYALSYSALKLVSYAFFFWLPFYLNRRFHWSQADADNLSTWFDIGGIVGGISIGFLSDRFNRPGVMFVNLVLSLPIIFIYNFLPGNKLFHACTLFLIGYVICGIANVLAGAMAADLGRHPKLSSNKTALATISGIMDGTGSTGAALGQIAIPLIEGALGWPSVFWMLLACVTLTSIGIGRMVISDLRRWKHLRNVTHCCEKGTKKGNVSTSSSSDSVGETAHK